MVDLTALYCGILNGLSKRGLIVVWNITSRCNLNCIHCYSGELRLSKSKELKTAGIKKIIEDLKTAKVNSIIFSGGEPLLRRDIFNIANFARNKGIRVTLSSNGILIDKKIALKIKEAGIGYVGISIDGIEFTHNILRYKKDAYRQAIQAVRICQNMGIKTGIRFTIAQYNIKELKNILQIVEELGCKRFCLYHLVYSGRGKKLISSDLSNHQRRLLIDELLKYTGEYKDKIQVLTTDNPCDGVYAYSRIKPDMTYALRGGCSAGIRLFNIDVRGDVHPCQFWQDYTIGNVLEKSFYKIVRSNDELLYRLRHKEEFLKGKCGICQYKSICCGCRVRAKFIYGDIWQEDPSCYLSEDEVKKQYELPLISSASAAAK